MHDLVECKRLVGSSVMVARKELVFRPSAYGIVPHAGKILMVRLRANGKLFLPGGGAEPGESMEQAMHREMFEETGLRVTVERQFRFLESFFYSDYVKRGCHSLCFIYACKPLGDPLAIIAGDPHEGMPEWVDPHAVGSDDVHGFAAGVLAEFSAEMRASSDRFCKVC